MSDEADKFARMKGCVRTAYALPRRRALSARLSLTCANFFDLKRIDPPTYDWGRNSEFCRLHDSEYGHGATIVDHTIVDHAREMKSPKSPQHQGTCCSGRGRFLETRKTPLKRLSQRAGDNTFFFQILLFCLLFAKT